MKQCENYIFKNQNFVDLTIYQFGYEECEPMHLFGPAIRNHYLIHFVLNGKGQLQILGNIYTISKGEAFLIPPGIPTTYYADATNPWHYVWIEFDGLKAENYLKEAGLSTNMPIFIPKSKDSYSILKDRFLYFINNNDESTPCLIGNLYLLFDSLIKESSRKVDSKIGSLKEFYVREAINFIEQNYYKNISVEDIASNCNLNRSYFSKLFKDSLSSTPQEFLMRYRLNKACELLMKTDNPINEISIAIGYENPLHFSRAFKKVYGISPRYYRNKNKEIKAEN